jgi:alpha-ribazole phosphatase/probable phosphoglycerate mutase
MPLRNYRMLVQDNAAITTFTLAENGDFTLEHLNSKF